MSSLTYYSPGIMLVLLGITIVAVPQILVALVAATIILAGIWSLYIGHMVKKSGTKFEIYDDRFTDRAFYGRHFAQNPVYRWWDNRF